jgi:prepilin-type N-terminal cleavage/methylation domain-containing protein
MKTGVIKQTGFTIVELLVVIVVIAILATISTVAYRGTQTRAKNAALEANIKSVQEAIEVYYVKTGSYPATQAVPITSGSWGSGRMTYADANCPYNFVPYNGVLLTTKTANWVPDIDMDLPQSSGQKRGTTWGCFLYQSDGSKYVLSAWNMVADGPQTDTLYRRVGFREMGQMFQVYYCNYSSIGGNIGGVYDANRDFYKYSYTASSITNCNETPPSGA